MVSSKKQALLDSIRSEVNTFDNPGGDCIVYSDFLFKTLTNTSGKRYEGCTFEFPRSFFPRGDATLGPTFVILRNKDAARIYTKMRRFVQIHGDPIG